MVTSTHWGLAAALRARRCLLQFLRVCYDSLNPVARLAVVVSVCRLASWSVEAAEYHAGPGQQFQTIGALPWESLAAGDTVYIHWRPDPYREKIFISSSGTANQPIRIAGVPGPQGERPVIDGENATTSPQFRFPYSGTATRGLVVISRSQAHEDGYKPKYIEIDGLELRNAAALYTFQDAQGAAVQYRPNAASVFIERGDYITIRNCALNGSGNGFFVASGDGEAFQSREILAERNEIFGNGNAGSDREHNVYTEAIGMVFQFNRFGRLRPEAGGNNIKDRSAGTVVRYNWIEGGAQQLDLVDPEESANQTRVDPRYRTTLVYGNVIINDPTSASVVHYGGDTSLTDNYRKGTLHFYHNTVIFRSDQRIRWRVALLRLDTNDETADVRNNILFNVPASPDAPLSELSFMLIYGKANLGVNWINDDWLPARTGTTFEGTLTGTENLITGTDPGLNSVSGDFSPKAQSPVVDQATPRAAAIPESFEVLFSPLVPGISRIPNGTALDLGALEASSGGALLSIQRLLAPSGRFQINLSGPDGKYRLELSNDLKTWRESTTSPSTNGTLVFPFDGSNTSPAFFRAVLLPPE